MFAWAQNEQMKAHALAGDLDAGKATNPGVSFPGKAQGLAGLSPLTQGKLLSEPPVIRGRLVVPTLLPTSKGSRCIAVNGVCQALHKVPGT